MYGLAGAQRTGKSTLATAFGQDAGIPAVLTTATEVFINKGLDPKVDYPLEVRLDIQRWILEAFEKQYRAVPGGVFIADRTPIDMIAYTLADIQRANVPDQLEGVVQRYVKDCFDVCNMHFSILTVVQPGIKVVEAAGKAPASYAYTEHINHLVLGLVVSEKVEASHFYIPRHMIDLKQRIDVIHTAIRRTKARYEEASRRREGIGGGVTLH